MNTIKITIQMKIFPDVVWENGGNHEVFKFDLKFEWFE